jgi:hypothetical protein
VILVSVLGLVLVVVLLVVVPSVVIFRDLSKGRPDVEYREREG